MHVPWSTLISFSGFFCNFLIKSWPICWTITGPVLCQSSVLVSPFRRKRTMYEVFNRYRNERKWLSISNGIVTYRVSCVNRKHDEGRILKQMKLHVTDIKKPPAKCKDVRTKGQPTHIYQRDIPNTSSIAYWSTSQFYYKSHHCASASLACSSKTISIHYSRSRSCS